MSKPRLLPPASASKLAAQIRSAIGASADEEITFITPQFERDADEPPPASAPDDADAWEALRTLDRRALKEIGLRAWDEPDANGNVLMLFPGEWYERIPHGYPIVNIFGERKRFVPGETDNNTRFGCLAYGIEARAE